MKLNARGPPIFGGCKKLVPFGRLLDWEVDLLGSSTEESLFGGRWWVKDEN
jgi:hypothetical protein